MPDAPASPGVKNNMRELEFIHAREDVSRVLHYANNIGLIIRNDHPTDQPQSDVVSPSEIDYIECGVFMLYKPSWVYGEPKFGVIPGGANAGKYSQNPATNYVSLVAYFSGERSNGSRRLLGNGFISRDTEWFRSYDKTIHRADYDVEHTFGTLIKSIGTGMYLRGGVHIYSVLKYAQLELQTGIALPPFDYIEWPSVDTQ